MILKKDLLLGYYNKIPVIINMILLIVLTISVFVPEFVEKKNRSTVKNISRIITLAPADSQTIKYVGLTNLLVAVSTYEQEFPSLPRISGGVLFDEEKLLSFYPDLILASSVQHKSESFEFIRKKGIDILTLATESIGDIYSNLVAIENIFPQTKGSAQKFYSEYLSLKNNIPYQTESILIIISIDPIVTVSQNTLLSEVFSLGGWSNVVISPISYPILLEEELLKIKGVDRIVIPEYYTNEIIYLKNIQQLVQAEKITFITNKNFYYPSPYILELSKDIQSL